jgi:quinolinate synthase
MAEASTQQLCESLKRIAQFLENGDAEAAAVVMTELNGLLPNLPQQMQENEQVETKNLLERCMDLERDLRQKVVDSLKQLAATRKSTIYQQYHTRP